MNRIEAINIAGIEAVESAEAETCEPTGAVGYNGSTQGDDLIEWSSHAPCTVEGRTGTLTVIYYTDRDDEEEAKDLGEWGHAGWDPVEYLIG